MSGSQQTEWWTTPTREDDVSDLFDSVPAQAPPTRRQRSGGSSRNRRRRGRGRGRTVVVMLVALALVAGAGFVVFQVVGPLFEGGTPSASVEDYPGPGHPSAEVVVSPGDTGADMAATLTEAGVVASSGAFTRAFAANPDAATIAPGTYTLLLEMKASDAVTALLDPASRVSMKVTIPEGYITEQTLARISQITTIPVEDLEAAAQDGAAIGLPEQADGNLEGWLYPATYEIEPGWGATDVLAEMVGTTVSTLEDLGVPKDEWQTVITTASIIEREAKLDDDRPKVARAMANRIEQGMPLQVDATVAYGLGIPGTELTRDDTLDESNPYNTYAHLGLPPGPISSPGRASIDAVLHPADGPWLFWATVNLDTGETKFAETLDQHNVHVAELRAWQAANPDE